MEPLRFEDWCLNTYAVIRKEDEHRRATAREYRMHELLVEQWQRLATAARAELEPLVQRHDATVAAVDELEAELHRAATASAAAEAELAQVETAYESMRQHIDRGGMDGPTFEQAIVAARDLDARRRTLAQSLRESARAIESCTKKLESRRSEAASLREDIAVKQRVISDVEKGIGNERIQLSEVIGRQREAWT